MKRRNNSSFNITWYGRYGTGLWPCDCDRPWPFWWWINLLRDLKVGLYSWKNCSSGNESKNWCAHGGCWRYRSPPMYEKSKSIHPEHHWVFCNKLCKSALVDITVERSPNGRHYQIYLCQWCRAVGCWQVKYFHFARISFWNHLKIVKMGTRFLIFILLAWVYDSNVAGYLCQRLPRTGFL